MDDSDDITLMTLITDGPDYTDDSMTDDAAMTLMNEIVDSDGDDSDDFDESDDLLFISIVIFSEKSSFV